MINQKTEDTRALPDALAAQTNAAQPEDSQVCNPAPHIHQLWSTAPDFHGGWSCGPCSTVMAVAACSKLQPKPFSGSGMPSDYGWYVSNHYHLAGIDYYWTGPHPWGRAPGAHGYMVAEDGLTHWIYVKQYMELHGLTPNVLYGGVTQDWCRGLLDTGHVIVISGQVFGYGHLILMRGYTADGRYIVNDPYGDAKAGSWGHLKNGDNAVYTWGEINPKAAWAVRG